MNALFQKLQQHHPENHAWRRWVAAFACLATLAFAAPAAAAPSYFSYWGHGRNIPETQDHVNLYWAVSWLWDSNEILSQLAEAKARGMRAMVHTEFAMWNAGCPVTLRADAAAQWNSFAQALFQQGLLDTVAAFYPIDEPDLCEVPANVVLAAFNIIRNHPLTAGKPITIVFGCEIAEKYGGIYRITGEHKYGDVLRAADWVGVDCYGSDDIFTEPAWTTVEFDRECFCFRRVDGPSYYDNLKAQLDLPRQRVVLIPQGFVTAEDAPSDDPQLYANRASADPSVILIAPFRWFDQPGSPGIRSLPDVTQQWRAIGRSISTSNPPNANPPFTAPVQPRLRAGQSVPQHFNVYDVNCNPSVAEVCTVQLHWELLDTTAAIQVFMRYGTSAPQLVTCSLPKSSIDIPFITAGANYTFDLYQMAGCPATVAPNVKPIASVNMALLTASSGGFATILEFYNASLDHYFISWMPGEITKLDAGTAIKGWLRTGKTLTTYTAAQTGSSPVCRFYIPPALGDSHFFGRGTTECNETAQKNPSFVLEDPAFMHMFLPVAGVCPPNTTEVYRVFDNRPDANHRYMTEIAVRNQMVAAGWIAEGDGPNMVTMCAPR